ncbi:hypothetical protein Cpap_3747 [Ruminiclostridium papyrosolvens DSM 2782]|uniref:Uncharacterized protein n=1 Tax=Ruminiclostridium papyrosolvens DSM 2782 TaxID=588581 RepID=F1T767_9FIRM|nr:hypothetical protein [Ruminiclostridium papyrosolvens]EGD49315.1 hypothetical protein Cpap_3747 [Ruminiclostridium papyrosolvens DSM 2782]WES33556.1 hypothetical protein P0092_17570 [Ruminiclostridium papyrosolvens DSM 2782]
MENEIKKLRDEINQLQNKIQNLQYKIHLLYVSKQAREIHPYVEFLLGFDITEQKKEKIEFALELLSNKYYRRNVFVLEDNKLTEEMENSNDIYITKSITEAYPQKLFENKLPSYTEVVDIFLEILDTKNKKIVFDLLWSVYKEGMFENLLMHVLITNPNGESGPKG